MDIIISITIIIINSFFSSVFFVFFGVRSMCAMTQSYDTNTHEDPSGYDRQDCCCAPGVMRHDTWTYETFICVRRSDSRMHLCHDAIIVVTDHECDKFNYICDISFTRHLDVSNEG